MALEIQSIEENRRVINEAQNIVHKDNRTIQDLINRSEKLEKETHEAFIKPRSKIQRKQRNTTKIEIFVKIAIIVIFIIPIIIIVHFTSIQFYNCLPRS